jgi:D-3-phosphoglycerate dehydrogenase
MLKVLQPYLELCRKIGAFQGQIARMHASSLKKLNIVYSGQVTDYQTPVLTSTLIQTFLSAILDAPVNFVNARNLAASRGIGIEEKTIHQVKDFANQITLEVIGKERSNLLAGAVFGSANCRFVRFNNFYLEVIPQGHLLVIHNWDRPGVVGKIGSVLGTHGINISRMQVALDSEEGEGAKQNKSTRSARKKPEAVAFINIDQSADTKVQQKLKALENVIALYQVELN